MSETVALALWLCKLSVFYLTKNIFLDCLQDKLVQKDFNIADEASGIGKPTIKQFNATVTNNILEIRFYWAGKGTTRIPVRGVYGPLISAISVDPGKQLMETCLLLLLSIYCCH